MWMRTRIALGLAAVSSLLVAIHCGSDADDSTFTEGGGVCQTVYAGKCGTPCSHDEDCAAGVYCGADGKCTADCAIGVAACADGTACSDRGRCGGGSPPFVPPTDSSFDSGDFGDACADIDLTLGKTTPTVVLLVDQSGSMTTDFPAGSGTSRWDVLRGALIDPDGGIVKTLDKDVTFGLTLYTWPKNVGACPALTKVAVAMPNYSNIYSVYADAAPVDNTPTAESIYGVVGMSDAGVLNDAGFAAYDAGGPKIIILATDGDPDTCDCPNCNGKQGPRDGVVLATQRTFGAGIKTYVIAIGAEIDQDHQQKVANAGLGFDPDAGDAAPLFRTSNRQELVSALDKIILGSRSCKFTLNGAVQPGTESQGTVTLNMTKLGYNDPNGWKLNSPTELEVVGTACDTVKNTVDAKLTVRFPCGTVLPTTK